MRLLLFLLIGMPLLEIFLMIKVGYAIGAFNTILLIIFTAITGVYFARLEGLNTLRSGMSQLFKNEIPLYEMISGAAIAFAAFLLIFPGFITDFVGFMLIIPYTRKFLIKLISVNLKTKYKSDTNIIDSEAEEIKDEEKDFKK